MIYDLSWPWWSNGFSVVRRCIIEVPAFLLFDWLGPQRAIRKEEYAGGRNQSMIFFSKRQKNSSLCADHHSLVSSSAEGVYVAGCLPSTSSLSIWHLWNHLECKRIRTLAGVPPCSNVSDLKCTLVWTFRWLASSWGDQDHHLFVNCRSYWWVHIIEVIEEVHRSPNCALLWATKMQSAVRSGQKLVTYKLDDAFLGAGEPLPCERVPLWAKSEDCTFHRWFETNFPLNIVQSKYLETLQTTR